MLIKRLVIPVSQAKEPWWISIYWSSKGTYRKGTGDIFLGPGYVRGRFLSAFTASWVKRLTAIHQIAVFVSRIIFIWNHYDHFWKFSIFFFPLWASKVLFSTSPFSLFAIPFLFEISWRFDFNAHCDSLVLGSSKDSITIFRVRMSSDPLWDCFRRSLSRTPSLKSCIRPR